MEAALDALASSNAEETSPHSARNLCNALESLECLPGDDDTQALALDNALEALSCPADLQLNDGANTTSQLGVAVCASTGMDATMDTSDSPCLYDQIVCAREKTTSSCVYPPSLQVPVLQVAMRSRCTPDDELWAWDNEDLRGLVE